MPYQSQGFAHVLPVFLTKNAFLSVSVKLDDQFMFAISKFLTSRFVHREFLKRASIYGVILTFYDDLIYSLKLHFLKSEMLRLILKLSFS